MNSLNKYRHLVVRRPLLPLKPVLVLLNLILLCLIAHFWPSKTELVFARSLKDAPLLTQDKEREPVTLEPNKTIRGQLSGIESHDYQQVLAEGQYCHIVVEQQGIDLVISVIGPDGKQVAQVDRPSGSRGPEAVSFVAQASGIYRIRMRGLEKAAPRASYAITADQPRAATPQDETRIQAEQATSNGETLRAQATDESLPRSIEEFKRALLLWQTLGERYEQALALYGLGWSYNEIGSRSLVKLPLPLDRIRWGYESKQYYKKASQCFRQSLAIMQELGDRYGEAIALTGVAWPNLYMGRTQEAFDDLTRALEIHRSFNNRRGEAITLYGISWIYALSDEPHKALAGLLESLPLRKAVNDRRGEALTISAIGRIYHRLGKDEEALAYLERAYDAFSSLGNKYSMADTLSNLGWVYISLHENQKALDLFERALPLRKEANDRSGEANTIYGIARVKSETGDLTGACFLMEKVLEIIELLRDKGLNERSRTLYLANVHEYYEFYVDILMKLHRAHPTDGFAVKALQLSERARARSLLDSLSGIRNDLSQKGDPDLTPMQPLLVAEIQQLLDKETLLVEYSLGKERSYAWVVTSTSMHSYELPSRDVIESTARQVYDLLTSRIKQGSSGGYSARNTTVAKADAQYAVAAARLSNMVLGPLAVQLDKKRLLIVTQGALQYIPFNALPIPGDRLANFTPLVVKHEVVYLPSASTLAALRRQEKSRIPAAKTVAVLADPVFTLSDPRIRAIKPTVSRTKEPYQVKYQNGISILREGEEIADQTENGLVFPRLPGTRWEAKGIISLVSSDQSLLALDSSANRETAMSPSLSNYRILHFATHATIDSESPELSAIVLSVIDEQGLPQPGHLTLQDVFNMKLRAELVVLSACNTALGQDVEGEGLVGMARGFMYAGASRVLASLWALDNQATTELMVRFYKGMLGPERMSPAEALRSAQIEMWKDSRWHSPYFWAGFVLQGESR